MTDPKPLEFSYDPLRDILTIEGMLYSGYLFRSLATLKPGSRFEIIERQNGLITCRALEVVKKGD